MLAQRHRESCANTDRRATLHGTHFDVVDSLEGEMSEAEHNVRPPQGELNDWVPLGLHVQMVKMAQT